MSTWNFHDYEDQTTGERRQVITDGYWTLQLVSHGVVGLVAWVLLMLLPVVLFVRTHPVGAWRNPLVAIAAAMSLTLVLYTIDCLLNANINPIYTLIAGGLVGLPALRRSDARTRADMPRPLERAWRGSESVEGHDRTA